MSHTQRRRHIIKPFFFPKLCEQFLLTWAPFYVIIDALYMHDELYFQLLLSLHWHQSWDLSRSLIHLQYVSVSGPIAVKFNVGLNPAALASVPLCWSYCFGFVTKAQLSRDRHMIQLTRLGVEHWLCLLDRLLWPRINHNNSQKADCCPVG